MILKPQSYLPLGIVIVVTVAILKLPDRTTDQLELGINELFLPLLGLTASAGELSGKAGNVVVSKKELAAQVDQLGWENDQLRIQLFRATAIAEENKRLRATMQLKEQTPWSLKLAQVVGRDPANWWRTIKINVGLRDHIPTNAPVLTARGLVGRVSKLSYSHAQVVLLGDPDCRVSALIRETRDHGVISPASSSPLDNILVDMNYLSRNSPLKAGQDVLTSGLGGIFPKGIPIGKIVDFHDVDFGLYNAARVRVNARLNALEEVWVLME